LEKKPWGKLDGAYEKRETDHGIYGEEIEG
jgi:hypothetical protein